MKARRNVVRIVNPAEGGQSYTSTKNAERFIRRGVAEACAGGIRMLRGAVRQNADEREREADDRLIERERHGRVWWNGARGHNAAYPPFCNVSFPRPGDRRALRTHLAAA